MRADSIEAEYDGSPPSPSRLRRNQKASFDPEIPSSHGHSREPLQEQPVSKAVSQELKAVYAEFSSAGSIQNDSAFQPAKLFTASDFGPDLHDFDATTQRPDDLQPPSAEWLSQPFAAGWQAPPPMKGDLSSGNKPGDFLSTVQFGQWLPPERRSATNVHAASSSRDARAEEPVGLGNVLPNDPDSGVEAADAVFQ